MKAGLYLINKDAMSNAGRKLCPQSKFFKQLVVEADHGDAKEPVDFVFELWFKKFLQSSFPPALTRDVQRKICTVEFEIWFKKFLQTSVFDLSFKTSLPLLPLL